MNPQKVICLMGQNELIVNMPLSALNKTKVFFSGISRVKYLVSLGMLFSFFNK